MNGQVPGPQADQAPRTLGTPRFANAVIGSCGLLYGAVLVLALWVIWNNLNPLQVDLAGHIASARSLWERGLHAYLDTFFQGLVQNLFYPPLEDFLIGLAAQLCSGDYLIGYKLYLTGLCVAYFVSIWACALCFDRTGARATFLLGMAVLVCMDKRDLVEFQGLSLIDMFVTGLSAETLGAVFLLLLLRQLMTRADWRLLTPLLALSLLSHLVVGPVAVLAVLLAATFGRSIELLLVVAGAVALSAFFLIPAILSRSHLGGVSLREPAPLVVEALLCLTLMLLWREGPSRLLPATGLALLLPIDINAITENVIGRTILPTFHYYRLHIFAIVLLVAALAAVVERSSNAPPSRILRRVVLALAVLVALRDFPVHGFDLESQFYAQQVLPDADALVAPQIGRTLSISPDRAIDFFIETGSYAATGKGRFVKGLYWESHRNNGRLSAYLATLLSPDGQVLGGAEAEWADCDEYACLFDHFVRDYSIDRVVYPELDRVAYLSKSTRACLAQLLEAGSTRFQLSAGEPVTIGRENYTVRELSSKGDALRPHLLLPVGASAQFVDAAPEGEHGGHELTRELRACRAQALDRSFRVDRSQLERLRSLLVGSPTGDRLPVEVPVGDGSGTQLKRWSTGEHADRLFLLALSSLPGLSITDERGEPLEAWPTDRGILIKGHGDVVVSHELTPAMTVSRLASALSWIGWCGASIYLTWRRRSRDSSRGANDQLEVPVNSRPA